MSTKVTKKARKTQKTKKFQSEIDLSICDNLELWFVSLTKVVVKINKNAKCLITLAQGKKDVF